MDEPLTNLATKVPKKEKEVDLLDLFEKPAAKAKPKAAEKRKATTAPKAKATPPKKVKVVKVVKEAKPSASKEKVVEKKKKGRFQRLIAALLTRLLWDGLVNSFIE